MNNLETVFSYKGKNPTEIPSLIAYGSELIMCLNTLTKNREEAGVYVSSDGCTWEKVASGIMNFWSYQVFDGDLYVGASTFDGKKTYVFRYDGSEFQKVLELAPGGGGGGGLVESLGVFKNTLYAGRRNEIWRSFDGEKWEKVFEFNTGKSLYQFFEYRSMFYVFEGEPIRSPSRVYCTENGKEWKEYREYSHVEWFRSHSPSDRVVLRYPYVADGRGAVYFFDGELHKFFERKQVRQPYNVAIRLKTFEDRLFIVYGAGTCAPARGEVWVWDEYKCSRILSLPFGVYDVEVFGGYLYLACNNWSQVGGFCESLVIRIPAHLKYEQPPLALSLTANGIPLSSKILRETITTDPVPVMGYRRKTLYLYPKTNLTLVVEVFSVNGDWLVYDRVKARREALFEYSIPCEGRMVRFRLESSEPLALRHAYVYLSQ
ncbi:MAG TPA: hypothetical protein ENF55_03255 [Thermoprotei archaeon]|nr:hypothetical protein [Thermoprotei archaeon]